MLVCAYVGIIIININ